MNHHQDYVGGYVSDDGSVEPKRYSVDFVSQ